MKQVMTNSPFTQTLPYFFLINSLKSISILKTKKSLMKPDTVDFKSVSTFPATTIPTPLSAYAFKTQN